MLAALNVSDAWKGIGAVVAVALFVMPFEAQANLVGILKRRQLLVAVALVLVAVHLVPASDHIPKLITSPNFADAWKALGSTVAIMWFVAPRAVHIAVLRVFTRARPLALIARRTKLRIAAVLVAASLIIASYPYTLEIVGHSHTYGHYTSPYPREVLIGNGFGVFKQRSDGAIVVVDMIDYQTLKADSYFHFVVTPTGTLTK
jgi:hypothetical protein